jgi:hypothetical protein
VRKSRLTNEENVYTASFFSVPYISSQMRNSMRAFVSAAMTRLDIEFQGKDQTEMRLQQRRQERFQL